MGEKLKHVFFCNPRIAKVLIVERDVKPGKMTFAREDRKGAFNREGAFMQINTVTRMFCCLAKALLLMLPPFGMLFLMRFVHPLLFASFNKKLKSYLYTKAYPPYFQYPPGILHSNSTWLTILVLLHLRVLLSKWRLSTIKVQLEF